MSLIPRVRCALGLHRWGRWGSPAAVCFGFYRTMPSEFRDRQTRACMDCNTRRTRWSGGYYERMVTETERQSRGDWQ